MSDLQALSEFATRLSSLMSPGAQASPVDDGHFNQMALSLFCLQYRSVPIYQELCKRRGVTGENLQNWRRIPPLPTEAFKEFTVSSLGPENRTTFFQSSGTTQQTRSRHYHSAESLSLYQKSVLSWFELMVFQENGRGKAAFLALTPPPDRVPHSSLVHMFETIRREFGSDHSCCSGIVDSNETWRLEFDKILGALKKALHDRVQVLLMGTAFNFLDLLEYIERLGLAFQLPPGSKIIETGGYKGRSRTLPKDQLYSSLSHRFGIPPSAIVAEYGMSELSSQAYDCNLKVPPVARKLSFPPWVRTRIVSPETFQEVPEGETGLLTVYDLANVFSVMAIQTFDLAERHGADFILQGRATTAEPRGCSLMTQ